MNQVKDISMTTAALGAALSPTAIPPALPVGRQPRRIASRPAQPRGSGAVIGREAKDGG